MFSVSNTTKWALVVMAMISSAACSHSNCDRFVDWVAPVAEHYQKFHRIYPVPAGLEALAKRYLPRLWVHPQSWQPICFEDYLRHATLVARSDGRILMIAPSAAALAALNDGQQCDSYLEVDVEIAPCVPAPVYIQVFRDRSPVDPQAVWIYVKYNLVFDWSGLAQKISWLTRASVFLCAADPGRWHRLDIHTAAVLAFDARHRLRLVTLAQHNYQQTYIAGVDLPDRQRPRLVAAQRSNELYLDRGQSTPVAHRVVTFFPDVAYLIDPGRKPWLRGTDITVGRNTGATEIALYPVFIPPGHPLAHFKGLLAPPQRFLGFYIGRDGPPGYDYYAPPAYTALADFAAMGYWRAGDLDLLNTLKPYLKTSADTDWPAIVKIMRHRLAEALATK